jgi:hypothetical protein
MNPRLGYYFCVNAEEVHVRRIDVVKKGGSWVGRRKGKTVPGTKAKTKRASVKKTAAVARKAKKPTSVRIHKVNGRIQEERTYPRAADPKKSKG